MTEHVLDLQGISRSFGAVHALERVDLSLARGEVLVLNDNFCVRINEILNPEADRYPESKAG